MTSLFSYSLVRVLLAVALAAVTGTVMPSPAAAFSRTLDEIFRDTVRGENDGELPAYVVNRGRVPFPDRKPLTPDELAALNKGLGPSVAPVPVTREMAWDDVVRQVANGSPDPFAVETVRSHADRNEPQAIELLAWMTANGVGLQRDLPGAFELYTRANEQGVASAKENAQAIYKAMTVEQRRTVFNPF